MGRLSEFEGLSFTVAIHVLELAKSVEFLHALEEYDAMRNAQEVVLAHWLKKLFEKLAATDAGSGPVLAKLAKQCDVFLKEELDDALGPVRKVHATSTSGGWP